MADPVVQRRRRLLHRRVAGVRRTVSRQVQRQLARRYAEVFGVILKHRDAVTRVTFWGLSDADSWLNRGRMNFPLLWDRQRQPKPAFNAVVDVLRNRK